MIRISRRLAAIGALAAQGGILADIGCDHGYLPIYLIQQHRIAGAIAMDVRQGPLSRARENIAAYGLLDRIEVRRSDGLAELGQDEAQTVVIAGMGGPLMEKILREGARQLATVRELILQPQSDVGHFRRFLQDLSFTIVEEDMVEEDGKYYPMMRLVPGGQETGGESRDSWDEADYRYGKYLLRGGHPVLGGYLQQEKKRLDRLEEGLRLSGSSRASTRLLQVLQEKKCIQEVQERYGFDM